jgi:hypothetical protein
MPLVTGFLLHVAAAIRAAIKEGVSMPLVASWSFLRAGPTRPLEVNIHPGDWA